MGYRPIRFSRITNHFATPGNYASRSDGHGPAGHHTGIDFAGPVPGVSIEGRFVRSSTPGKVVISEYNDTMGHWVGVHFRDEDVLITYWHLQRRAVEVDDFVWRGQVIGRVGSTGNSTAPHLHVQVNRGSTFSYHDHIPPGPWVRGKMWAGWVYLRRLRRQRRRS